MKETILKISTMAMPWVLVALSCPYYCLAKGQKSDTPKAVAKVDLNRYAGLWYEIAKIPNRFQKKCRQDTTAMYVLRPDGRLDVINRCVDKDGKIIEAKGIAKIVDVVSQARLKVSFVRFLGISLFWGDYWVIGLEENYRYAIVGTPDRKYGWILARQKQLSDEQMEIIFSLLKTQGYDPGQFAKTIQTR